MTWGNDASVWIEPCLPHRSPRFTAEAFPLDSPNSLSLLWQVFFLGWALFEVKIDSLMEVIGRHQILAKNSGFRQLGLLSAPSHGQLLAFSNAVLARLFRSSDVRTPQNQVRD